MFSYINNGPINHLFKVIIPTYNAERYVPKCLNSLINQTYKNWEALFIDDASTDNTYIIAKNIISRSPMIKNFTLLSNKENRGALYNIVHGINNFCQNDSEIIVFLDGDDWLADNTVLEYLNNIYNSDHVWLTYGQYATSSRGIAGNSKPLQDIYSYRKMPITSWCTSHLKTCKYLLWRNLNMDDFEKCKYNYYAWDNAIMFSLLEMAGPEHTKFIDKILYIYNDENPISDHQKGVQHQMTMANYWRSQPCYNPIEPKLIKEIENQKFDVLYTFQYQEEYKEKAILRLINSILNISKQPNIGTIYLIDGCKEKIKITNNLPVEHIHYPQKMLGVKAKLINFGMNLVKTKYCILSDIDIIYPPDFTKKIIIYLCNNIEYEIRYIHYNMNMLTEFYSQNYNDYYGKPKLKNNIAPGNGITNKNWFLKIGGLNNNYIGYGPEDACYNMRISFFNKYIEDKNNITIHQFHTRTNLIQPEKNNFIFNQIKNNIFSSNKNDITILNKNIRCNEV